MPKFNVGDTVRFLNIYSDDRDFSKNAGTVNTIESIHSESGIYQTLNLITNPPHGGRAGWGSGWFELVRPAAWGISNESLIIPNDRGQLPLESSNLKDVLYRLALVFLVICIAIEWTRLDPSVRQVPVKAVSHLDAASIRFSLLELD